MISVVIPAYNEESVISRTLKSLLESLKFEPGEIIVVCNGCVDKTFEVASSFGSLVQVFNLEAGSKTAALNACDAAAKYFPRFYLDADIVVSSNTFCEVAKVLRSGTIQAAAPEMKCIMDGSSWMVRAYYNTWLNRSYHKSGHIGSGFVGISEQGRRRFGSFPSIIADDEFVRRQFAKNERAIVHGSWFAIQTPSNLKSLVKVKTRSRLGTIQLQNCYPELTRISETTTDRTEPGDFVRPRFWVYAMITALARVRAASQWRRQQVNQWERDETSRQARSTNRDQD